MGNLQTAKFSLQQPIHILYTEKYGSFAILGDLVLLPRCTPFNGLSTLGNH